MSEMNRDQALDLVMDNVKAPGLRRHMLAVEAAMGFYAERLGEDVDLWKLAGLLHDYDWEIHPTLEAHPAEGVPRLREAGCPEPVLQAILSHNDSCYTVGGSTSQKRGICPKQKCVDLRLQGRSLPTPPGIAGWGRLHGRCSSVCPIS